jgi:formate dehydrogenase maturation protein FdhE
MSTLFICSNCLTRDEQEKAIFATLANDYVRVSSCPDCERGGE